ncbi:MAG: cation:proton antiporter, partial [Myxococcales bacterium]|nr:cation:proton antiporter [Myxococcales bacterium]
MSDVSVFLLCVSAIFLIGIVGELVFAKTGVPDVIWLIVVGAVLGPISGLVSKAMLQSIAPYFGALTLVIVLFNGGTGLKLRELSAAAGRGSLLAILSFLLAVAFIAPLTMLGAWMGVLPAE